MELIRQMRLLLFSNMKDVLIALIAGIFSFGGSWLAFNKQMALISYRLEQLEKKFDDYDINERLLKVEMRQNELEKKFQN